MTDEDKISRIYQQGKKQTPPAHIDDAILNMAREAVQPETSTPKKAKSPFSGGWPATAAIAAVLVITVILVPLMKQEEAVTEMSLEADEAMDVTKPVMLDDKVQGSLEQKEMASRSSELMKKQAVRSKQKSGASARVSAFKDELHILQSPAEVPRSRSTAIVNEERDEESLQAMEMMSAPALMSQPAPVAAGMTLSSDSARQVVSVETPTSDVIEASSWLDEIKRLIDKGDIELAKKELAKFKKTYPRDEISRSILDRLE